MSNGLPNKIQVGLDRSRLRRYGSSVIGFVSDYGTEAGFIDATWLVHSDLVLANIVHLLFWRPTLDVAILSSLRLFFVFQTRSHESENA